MIFQQNDRFLAILRQSQYNIITQNLQHLTFSIPFMALEYPLIFEIYLSCFGRAIAHES